MYCFISGINDSFVSIKKEKAEGSKPLCKFSFFNVTVFKEVKKNKKLNLRTWRKDFFSY